eukprot:UN20016
MFLQIPVIIISFTRLYNHKNLINLLLNLQKY